MSHFLSLCQKRASVRDYLPIPPSAEAVARIKEAVRLAPSACNKQPWRFFYVTQPDVLARLCATYPRPWLATAPALFVAVKNVEENWVRPADQHAHGDIDLAIAVEHLCLAAAEEGLGTCWVCNFDTQACAEILNLGANWQPVAMTPIGFPGEKHQDAGRKRKPVEEVFVDLV